MGSTLPKAKGVVSFLPLDKFKLTLHTLVTIFPVVYMYIVCNVAKDHSILCMPVVDPGESISARNRNHVVH